MQVPMMAPGQALLRLEFLPESPTVFSDQPRKGTAVSESRLGAQP